VRASQAGWRDATFLAFVFINRAGKVFSSSADLSFVSRFRQQICHQQFFYSVRPALAANKTSRKTERRVSFAKKASIQPTKWPTKASAFCESGCF
jgi:hypothetical protein